MTEFLFFLTSNDKLGDTGDKTGFHWEEMTTPYYKLQDAGINVEIASVKGGYPPYDPGSLADDESERPQSVKRFLADEAAMEKLKNTMSPNNINVQNYAGIYYPGGHGTMWDLATDIHTGEIAAKFFVEDKIVAAVCHGPAIFANPAAVYGTNATSIIKNKDINCFTDSEEREVEKDDIVPFMLESKLEALGAKIHKGENWEGFTIQDRNLITGQNPNACDDLADKIIATIDKLNTKAA